VLLPKLSKIDENSEHDSIAMDYDCRLRVAAGVGRKIVMRISVYLTVTPTAGADEGVLDQGEEFTDEQ